MYKNILIATDGSDLAAKGLSHGLALAKSLGAAATVVTVTEIWSAMAMAGEARHGNPSPTLEYEKLAAASAQRILNAAMTTAQAQGVAVETLHVADMPPAEGILQAAKSKGCDLIVMASHGRRGVSRLMLGSQAMEVVSYGEIPTLIVR
jgi:nucleotide-binding universal stress UspA family protein